MPCWGRPTRPWRIATRRSSWRPKRTATLFESRGYALVRAKRYEAAIRDYNAALGIDPKYATALWGRGYAYLRLGDKAKADKDFQTAKVIDAAIDYKMVELGLTR
jgi:Flp pilus assembly protein TadD